MTRAKRLTSGLLGCAVGLLFADPAGADDIHITVSIGTPPPVVVAHPPPSIVAAPPTFVVVPGMPVYYAPAVPYSAGRYYAFHDGAWFSAPPYGGPFVAVRQVPRPVLALPVA